MEYKKIKIDDIQLDVDNPRIKHYVEIYGENLSSEQIALALNYSGDSNTAYEALSESIRVNKGVIHPIIVNRKPDGTHIVIEGNTRVQLYREFREKDKSGVWDEIIALVYDDLPSQQIHAIRLQTHLVGPRDWEPFSKAKYLNYLSSVEYLPMATIISYCGGKTHEVRNLINAYNDMIKFYKPVVEDNGDDMSPRQFSKFAELQKIGSALKQTGYTKTDFAKWVHHGNVDTAQNVRKLPQVLLNERAREVFLKKNISEAVKLISAEEVKEGQTLANATNNELVEELIRRINGIEYSTVKALRYDPSYQAEKNNWETLAEELTAFIDDITQSD